MSRLGFNRRVSPKAWGEAILEVFYAEVDLLRFHRLAQIVFGDYTHGQRQLESPVYFIESQHFIPQYQKVMETAKLKNQPVRIRDRQYGDFVLLPVAGIPVGSKQPKNGSND